jgi:intein/homing endonuclease
LDEEYKGKQNQSNMNIGKVSPIVLNKNSAYLAGVIVGDGCIYSGTKSKTNLGKDYKITIEVIDLDFLKKVESLTKEIIKTKSTIVKRKKLRANQKQLYYFQFRNKSFYYFLTKDLEIPSGKKSGIVSIPQKILSNKNLQMSFISGLFDTDGGKRGKTIGFTSKSQKLIQEVSSILKQRHIGHFLESWKHKAYSSNYYGLKISRKDSDKFLKGLQLQSASKRQLLQGSR